MRRLTWLLILLLCVAPLWANAQPTFSQGDWKKILSAHKGKPLIVHFWAQTCGPCVVELTEWGKIHRQHPSLAMVMIQSDPLPDKPEAVDKLLRSTGLADVEKWSLGDLFDDKMRAEVDTEWSGELPLTLMLDGHHKVTKLVGEVDFKSVSAWIVHKN